MFYNPRIRKAFKIKISPQTSPSLLQCSAESSHSPFLPCVLFSPLSFSDLHITAHLTQLHTNSPHKGRLKNAFRCPTIGLMTFSVAQLSTQSWSREADRRDIYIWSHRRADVAVCQPVRNLQPSVRPAKHPVSQTGVHCEPAASSPETTTAPELCGLNGQSYGTRALGAQWGGYPGIQPFHWRPLCPGFNCPVVNTCCQASRWPFALCETATVMFVSKTGSKRYLWTHHQPLIVYRERTFVLKGKHSLWRLSVLTLPVLSSWLPSIGAMNVLFFTLLFHHKDHRQGP